MLDSEKNDDGMREKKIDDEIPSANSAMSYHV